MYIDRARELAAQCWCDPRTSNREMDVELAEVFAETLVRNSTADELTFHALRHTNYLRSALLWEARSEPFDGSDWVCALVGELGEAANSVKKINRVTLGHPSASDPSYEDLLDLLAEELADTMIYLDLLAVYYNINLGDAVIDKFNKVSEREGLPHRLGDQT